MNGRGQSIEERELERQYRRSVARKAAQPKGFGELLVWFLEGFRSEMPEAIHAAGVWSDHARLGEERRAVGGSLLGSPRLADPFRALIEGSPFATEPSEFEGHLSRDGDEHYRTPMRAAIARLNNRHLCTAIERMARGHDCPDGAIYSQLAAAIAFRAGDWQAAADQVRVRPRFPNVEKALYLVWREYRVSPPARFEEVAIAV